MISSIIGWIIFGLIVGGIARLLMPGEDPMGCLGTILLGVGGSFIGGFVVSMLMGNRDGLEPASFIGSLLGAVLLLFIGRKMRPSARVD